MRGGGEQKEVGFDTADVSGASENRPKYIQQGPSAWIECSWSREGKKKTREQI